MHLTRPRQLTLSCLRLIMIVALLAASVAGALVVPVPVAEARPQFAEFAPTGLAVVGNDATCSPTAFSIAKSGGGVICEVVYSFAQPVNATGWWLQGATQTNPDPWTHIEALPFGGGTPIVLFSGSNLPGRNSAEVIAITGCEGGCEIGSIRVSLDNNTSDKTITWTKLSLEGTVSTPTPTPTLTPTPIPPTATPFFPSGNKLINTDFNVAPRMPGYGWTDIARVVQAPLMLSPMPIDHMPVGSCGPKYWTAGEPLGLGAQASFFQGFDWEGGRMFINLEALTDSYQTRGRVTIRNDDTGSEEPLPLFTNGSFTWRTFRWVTSDKPAGRYTFAVDYISNAPQPGLAIDNVNLRANFWGNDCEDEYSGNIPGQGYATATALATSTVAPPLDGENLIRNCNFEQGHSSWSPNAGARLFYTGGATGPTYSYLFTVYDNGSDGQPSNVVGRIWQPFNWREGGRMYVSYFTGPGTRMSTSIRNLFTGAVYQMQPGTTVQSFNGWTKRSYSFYVSDPGQFIFDARTTNGQIAAIDGVTVSANAPAGGPCANANQSNDNNATATAHATQTQVAATAAPGQTQTQDANEGPLDDSYLTHVASVRQTSTQVAAVTQTAVAGAQQTLSAVQTAVQAARQTATAQGTPQPSVTPQPPSPTPTMNATEMCLLDPVLDFCWIVPPVTVSMSDADLTATAMAAGATGTAQAVAAETQFVAAIQTAQARAQNTQSAAQTQTALPGQQATQAVVLRQTATARAVQTQNASGNQTQVAANLTATAIAAGVSAQRTQDALASQAAAQAQATQTAAALQTQIAAAPDPATEAAATTTAQAYATAAVLTTGTAVAQRTADAQATAAAQLTAAAQATANQAATAVSLATQQAAQAQATQTAAAVQTALADDPEPTAEAQATATAQTHATSAAQTTATAQAAATNQVGTQVAQGTQQTSPDPSDLPPVDTRPEPQPGADCVRPTSPLQLANWIDYEVCRILTWFAWTPSNTDQVLALQDDVTQYQPFGFMGEWVEVFGLLRDWIGALPWCDTGFCRDQPLAPLNVAATGLLVGDFQLLPGTPFYSDQCDIMLAPLVGPAIQSGACFCVNVLCALGILPWAQLMFNITLAFVALVYIQRTWLTSAHT